MKNISILATMVALSANLILPTTALAKPSCVEAEGESLIISNDIPSAKAEAITRAKWAAIEQVAGLEVKSRTMVENSALLDDMITTQGRGIVTSYKLLRESKGASSISVKINACIEPAHAREATSAMALNSRVAVFIPSKHIIHNRYDDINTVSEAINNALNSKGFTVNDLAASAQIKPAQMDAALKSGNFLALRSLAYRHNSNTILIGRIEPTLSTNKGDDVGYGISMPFNRVTVRLHYRLLTRDPKGDLVLLSSGSIDAQGLAPNAEDAHANAMKDLSDKATNELMGRITKRIDQLANKVRIVVEGVKEVSEMFSLRDMLAKQNWVTDVKEGELGVFQLSYPENPIYLANSLSQRGFRVISYSRETIRIRKK